MTCYFRHIRDVFEKIGKVTKENKRQIDQVIHSMVGVEYKNCLTVWKEVKRRIAEDEEAFISQLRSLLNL